MYIQEYLDEECNRIKQETKKELEAILTPLEASLQSMQSDIIELEKLSSNSFIMNIIYKNSAK